MSTMLDPTNRRKRVVTRTLLARKSHAGWVKRLKAGKPYTLSTGKTLTSEEMSELLGNTEWHAGWVGHYEELLLELGYDGTDLEG